MLVITLRASKPRLPSISLLPFQLRQAKCLMPSLIGTTLFSSARTPICHPTDLPSSLLMAKSVATVRWTSFRKSATNSMMTTHLDTEPSTTKGLSAKSCSVSHSSMGTFK